MLKGKTNARQPDHCYMSSGFWRIYEKSEHNIDGDTTRKRLDAHFCGFHSVLPPVGPFLVFCSYSFNHPTGVDPQKPHQSNGAARQEGMANPCFPPFLCSDFPTSRRNPQVSGPNYLSKLSLPGSCPFTIFFCGGGFSY